MQAITDLNAVSSTIASSSDTKQANRLFSGLSVVCGAAIALCFAALLCYWHSLDSRQPSMDEAGHILCAFTYSDLFSHPQILRGAWWGKLLTVNNFYPPAVYAFNGLLKIALGPSHFVDWLSLAIYDFVLTVSIFATTLILTGRRMAACVAAVVVNFYSELISLSHTYLLDFQVAAMVSLGLFCLVFWRQAPNWKKTVACGISLALVLGTKQIAGAFLVGPGLFYFVSSLIKKEEGWKAHLTQLAVMTIMAGLSMVPWVVASYGFISEFAETNKKVITSKVGAISVPQALQRGLRYYFFALPEILSPFLLAISIPAILVGTWRYQATLIPVLLSSVLGVILISLLPWQYPHHRYIASALIAPAICTGAFFAMVWDSRLKLFSRILLSIASAIAVLQFVSLCFFPYPFSHPLFLSDFSNWMHATSFTMGSDNRGKATPVPYEDWGQKWALEVIGKRDPDTPVWLNVMANHVEYNPHTFTLQGKAMGSKVRPTSSRTWTVLGDTVSFSQESALYYQWYLIKTGDAGHVLLNEESKVANENILKFVRESGKFDLMAKRKVPDGSEILLFRQK